MAEFIVDDISWKKGETGSQKFILYESDGETRRDGTDKSYSLNIWKRRSNAIKSGGELIPINAEQGEHEYIVQLNDTNIINNYVGEIVETDDDNTYILRSETFKVIIEESSDFSV